MEIISPIEYGIMGFVFAGLIGVIFYVVKSLLTPKKNGNNKEDHQKIEKLEECYIKIDKELAIMNIQINNHIEHISADISGIKKALKLLNDKIEIINKNK